MNTVVMRAVEDLDLYVGFYFILFVFMRAGVGSEIIFRMIEFFSQLLVKTLGKFIPTFFYYYVFL